MAGRIPMRPPRYSGGDPEIKRMAEYLEYLYQTLDYQLSELYRRLEARQETTKEE